MIMEALDSFLFLASDKSVQPALGISWISTCSLDIAHSMQSAIYLVVTVQGLTVNLILLYIILHFVIIFKEAWFQILICKIPASRIQFI
jgi:hypothetical protein